MPISNCFKGQKGVALIQVLLISLVIIIMVIKINHDAKLQVNLAIKLKDKAELERHIFSTAETLKFAMLVEDRNTAASNTLSHSWNFYGEPVTTSGGVKINLQDMDGKVSLPYSGKEIEKLIPEIEFVHRLKAWQGEYSQQYPRGYGRGGLMQSHSEVKLIEGWKYDSTINLVTYFPTKIFNLFNAPAELLHVLFEPEKTSQLLAMRDSGNQSQQDWMNVTGNEIGFSIVGGSGEFVEVSVAMRQDDLEITRYYLFRLTPDLKEPLVKLVK